MSQRSFFANNFNVVSVAAVSGIAASYMFNTYQAGQTARAQEETKRKEAEEATKRKQAEEETKRMQPGEETRRKEAEEETKRILAEEETKRKKAEEETKRMLAKEETKRKQDEEETKRTLTIGKCVVEIGRFIFGLFYYFLPKGEGNEILDA